MYVHTYVCMYVTPPPKTHNYVHVHSWYSILRGTALDNSETAFSSVKSD